MGCGGSDGSDAMSARAQGDARDFANAVLTLLAVARRTRGRLQPLFDDVTVPQLVLLDAVEACGAEGVAAVAAYTALTQPTVTQQAAALEAAGLLVRTSSEDDRRRRILTLTEGGEHVLAAKRTVVAELLSTAWESLDDTERAVAVPLLRHLAGLIVNLA